MNSPAAGVEAEPVSPGEKLVSLFSQLRMARFSLEIAETALQPLDNQLKELFKEYGVTGYPVPELPEDQLAKLGGNAMRMVFRNDEVKERRARAEEETTRLKEELLNHASSLAGKEMEVEALPHTSGAIGYMGGLRKGGALPRPPRLVIGTLLQRPALHVLEERLELVQVGFRGVAQNTMYGNFDIQPTQLDGTPRVAITVDA